MKILFATDDGNLESTIAKRFGHANYYIIYDTNTKSLDVRSNSGHDENHSSLIELMNENVTHFVIGNIGPAAFEVLKNGNAKIYLARKLIANEALNKLINNSLEELDNPTLKRSIESHGDGHHHSHDQHRHGHGKGRGLGRGKNHSHNH